MSRSSTPPAGDGPDATPFITKDVISTDVHTSEEDSTEKNGRYDEHNGQAPTKGSVSPLHVAIHNVNLNLARALFRSRRGKKLEEPKVAINKGYLAAIAGQVVHVVPVAGCFVLLYLNLAGFYIGSELAGAINQDSAKVNALQFAAKLHEITMVTSISVVIFGLLRRKLVSDKEVPLGALVAGFQFTDMKYFWSRELWASFKPMLRSCGWGFVVSSWRRLWLP